MSCDWNIYCRACDATHTFNDANHRLELMQLLIEHRHAIAGLAELFEHTEHPGLVLQTGFGRVDPMWFLHHSGHPLVPISEYGDIIPKDPAFTEKWRRERRGAVTGPSEAQTEMQQKNCHHPRTERGKDVPRRWGSFRSEVCCDCGCFRTLTHHNEPVGPWRPVDEYEQATTRGDLE